MRAGTRVIEEERWSGMKGGREEMGEELSALLGERDER